MLFTIDLQDFVTRAHLLMDRYKWTLDYVESLTFEELKFWSDIVKDVRKQELDAESEKNQAWSKFFVELFKRAFGSS